MESSINIKAIYQLAIGDCLTLESLEGTFPNLELECAADAFLCQVNNLEGVDYRLPTRPAQGPDEVLGYVGMAASFKDHGDSTRDRMKFGTWALYGSNVSTTFNHQKRLVLYFKVTWSISDGHTSVTHTQTEHDQL